MYRQHSDVFLAQQGGDCLGGGGTCMYYTGAQSHNSQEKYMCVHVCETMKGYRPVHMHRWDPGRRLFGGH